MERRHFATHTHWSRHSGFAFDYSMLAPNMIPKAADAGVSGSVAVGWAIPSFFFRVALDSHRFSLKRDTCAKLMLLLMLH